MLFMKIPSYDTPFSEQLIHTIQVTILSPSTLFTSNIFMNTSCLCLKENSHIKKNVHLNYATVCKSSVAMYFHTTESKRQKESEKMAWLEIETNRIEFLLKCRRRKKTRVKDRDATTWQCAFRIKLLQKCTVDPRKVLF